MCTTGAGTYYLRYQGRQVLSTTQVLAYQRRMSARESIRRHFRNTLTVPVNGRWRHLARHPLPTATGRI